MHKQPPCSEHGPVAMLNEEDGIYAGPSTDGLVQANAGKYLMLNLSEDILEHLILELTPRRRCSG